MRRPLRLRFLSIGGRASTALVDDSADMVETGGLVETAPIVFYLVYEDAAGNLSQRIVTVRKIEIGRIASDASLLLPPARPSAPLRTC